MHTIPAKFLPLGTIVTVFGTGSASSTNDSSAPATSEPAESETTAPAKTQKPARP